VFLLLAEVPPKGFGAAEQKPMKAAMYSRRGSADLVQIQEVPQPVPKDDEVLLKVRAAAVNPLDSHLGHLLFGLLAPKSTAAGRDVAGVVEAVGRSVTQFQPGDAAFGVCLGAFAEYACVSASKVAAKPANVTFEQAASAPVAAYTALQGLRDKGRIQPGQSVLINGAAGGVGTFAVQITKWFGAEVTGVCSARNMELVRSLGADRVMDYAQEDFTRGERRYDLILDLVANHSLLACRRVLHPRGTYVGAGVGPHPTLTRALAPLFGILALSPFVSQKLVTFTARSSKEDLTLIGELMATGKVTPVVGQRYPLSATAEAIRYVAEGHARGKVVITLDDNARVQ
jgi:NADPH:quinone reductase-like Zn-dependent oxidoreductase